MSAYATLACADARTVAWEKPIDLLFIDGGEDRLGELDHFSPFLTPRALIAMHNAHDPGHGYQWERLDGHWNKILIPCPCGLFLLTKRA